MSANGRQIVIEVKELVKRFPGITAVDGVTFDVQRGEIFGLLGPNGAGKTTTLSCIEGLMPADGGEIRVLGADPAREPRQTKQKMGVQLQATSLLPELNVSEQIELFGELYGYKADRQETIALMERVSLSEKAQALPATMSGGQQQRLALALALVGRPEIVILDEPAAGLDPQARYRTWELVRELRDEGCTVVLTTHYMEEAEALCDRVGIIDHGKLLALDAPMALVKSLEGLSRISLITPLSSDLAQALPGVHSAWREQQRLHVRCSQISEVVAGLHEAAAAKEVAIEGLTVHSPNLEELFLNLTGRSIRE
jgi:ABC-2 type transport system ATP-binding protein